MPKLTPRAIATQEREDAAYEDGAGLLAHPEVAFVEDAQAREREVVVDLLDRARERRDQAREPAGRDDGARKAELLDEAVDEAVDEADVAVDDAGLHRVLRVATDHARRLGDLDARKLGGAGEERVGADLDAGRDDAAKVLALRRDAVEGRRGAEVDDDEAAAEALVRGDAVDDAIGADLARVLVEDRHAGADARADHERLVAERATHEVEHRLGERGHDARDDRGLHVRGLHVAHREQLAEDDGVLVGGPPAARLDAELVDQRVAAVEEPVDDVRVPDVDGEQHRAAHLIANCG